jgi:hypothetical protein
MAAGQVAEKLGLVPNTLVEVIERISRPARAVARFDLYRLRQRGARNVSVVAWSTCDCALGRSRSGGGKGHRGRNCTCLQGSYRMLNRPIGVFTRCRCARSIN